MKVGDKEGEAHTEIITKNGVLDNPAAGRVKGIRNDPRR
jgi:hypothetical protein